jgi:hypothetical protein
MIEQFALAIPLIAAVSLAWAATRHEAMPQILWHALSYALSVGAGMAALLLVLVLWPIIGTGWLSAIIGGVVLVTSAVRRIQKGQRRKGK